MIENKKKPIRPRTLTQPEKRRFDQTSQSQMFGQLLGTSRQAPIERPGENNVTDMMRTATRAATVGNPMAQAGNAVLDFVAGDALGNALRWGLDKAGIMRRGMPETDPRLANQAAARSEGLFQDTRSAATRNPMIMRQAVSGNGTLAKVAQDQVARQYMEPRADAYNAVMQAAAKGRDQITGTEDPIARMGKNIRRGGGAMASLPFYGLTHFLPQAERSIDPKAQGAVDLANEYLRMAQSTRGGNVGDVMTEYAPSAVSFAAEMPLFSKGVEFAKAGANVTGGLRALGATPVDIVRNAPSIAGRAMRTMGHASKSAAAERAIGEEIAARSGRQAAERSAAEHGAGRELANELTTHSNIKAGESGAARRLGHALHPGVSGADPYAALRWLGIQMR